MKDAQSRKRKTCGEQPLSKREKLATPEAPGAVSSQDAAGPDQVTPQGVPSYGQTATRNSQGKGKTRNQRRKVRIKNSSTDTLNLQNKTPSPGTTIADAAVDQVVPGQSPPGNNDEAPQTQTRNRFSKEELKVLEELFRETHQEPDLSPVILEQICEINGFYINDVQNWLLNRQQKEKKGETELTKQPILFYRDTEGNVQCRNVNPDELTGNYKKTGYTPFADSREMTGLAVGYSSLNDYVKASKQNWRQIVANPDGACSYVEFCREFDQFPRHGAARSLGILGEDDQIAKWLKDYIRLRLLSMGRQMKHASINRFSKAHQSRIEEILLEFMDVFPPPTQMWMKLSHPAFQQYEGQDEQQLPDGPKRMHPGLDRDLITAFRSHELEIRLGLTTIDQPGSLWTWFSTTPPPQPPYPDTRPEPIGSAIDDEDFIKNFFIDDQDDFAQEDNIFSDEEEQNGGVTLHPHPIHIVGLMNTSSNCYSNSIYQMLYSSLIIRNTVLSIPIPEEEKYNKAILNLLQKLFGVLMYTTRPDADPGSLNDALHTRKTQREACIEETGSLSNRTVVPKPTSENEHLQHDAIEFLMQLIEEVSNDEPILKQFFQEKFYASTHSSIVCQSPNCSYTRLTQSSALCISVYPQRTLASMGIQDSNTITLENGLEQRTNPEFIVNAVCEQCGDNIMTTEEHFDDLPEILFIHVQRVGFDEVSHASIKDHTRIDYPDELDFSIFIESSEPNLYILHAALLHIGEESASGHYVVKIRNPDNGRWTCFNDTLVQLDHVSSGGRNTSPEVYMLMYVKKDAVVPEPQHVVLAELKTCVVEWNSKVFCPECKKPYSSIQAMQSHRRNVHKGSLQEESKRTCIICGSVHLNPSSLATHVRRKHPPTTETIQDPAKATCSECQNTYSSIHAMTIHMRNVHKGSLQEESKRTCIICGSVHLNPSSLAAHVRRKHPPTTQTIQDLAKATCPECQKTYSSIHAMKVHMRNVHKGSLQEESKRTCITCGSVHLNPCSLATHVRRKHPPTTETIQDPAKATCSECQNTYSSIHAMTIHMRNVHKGSLQEESKRTCIICGSVHLNPSSLAAHVRRKHPPTTQTIQDLAKATCPECQKTYSSIHAMKVHMRNVHKGSLQEESKRTCITCGSVHLNPCSLATHVRRKHPPTTETIQDPATCPECQKNYSSIKAMQAHRRNIHEGALQEESKRTCQICGSVHSNPSSLAKHARSKHPPTTQTIQDPAIPTCPECQKNYSSIKAMKTHMRNVHKGALQEESKRTCQICGSVHSNPYSLKIHLRKNHLPTTQTIQDPAKTTCLECQKTYSSIQAMTIHIRNIHKGALHEESKRTCQICGSIHRNPRSLSTHMHSKHRPKRRQ